MIIYWSYTHKNGDCGLIYERDTVLKQERCIYSALELMVPEDWQNYTRDTIESELDYTIYPSIREITREEVEEILFMANI